MRRANPTLGGFDSHTFPPDHPRGGRAAALRDSAYESHPIKEPITDMRRTAFILAAVLAMSGLPAWGWLTSGHGVLTQAVFQTLPEEVPVFFRSSGPAVAHHAADPDVAKNRATAYLRGAEYPEHFLDREFLAGHDLPVDRFAFIQLCQDAGVKPANVGFLPYALGEWTERLVLAFAEHRKWPDNPHIQRKCLVYAGFIAHYAQDLCQPLHLTIHHNGRARSDGSSPRSGIHMKVDYLIDVLGTGPEALAERQEITALDDLMDGIMAQFERGFTLVDRVYELEAGLPDLGQQDWVPVPEVVKFGEERAREAVRFTATLYLTAWRRSGQVELPRWLDRARTDG